MPSRNTGMSILNSPHGVSLGGGVINRVIMTSDSKGFEKLYPRVLNYLKVEKKNKNEEHEISVSIIMHIVRV